MTMKSYCGNYEQYINYLEKCINAEDKSKISCPYVDPDETYRSEKYPNNNFYPKIVSFLNKREQEIINKEQRWKYTLKSKPDGTEIPLGIHANYRGKSICLRSDLFGFSAPKGVYPKESAWDNRYPYAKYLMESTAEGKCQQVANWIWRTRTVGGSFIWPVKIEWYQKYATGIQPIWSSWYNTNRGVNFYLQDRVDLTLFEVMHYYDHKTNGSIHLKEYAYTDDVLYMDLKRASNPTSGIPYMQIWLDHFDSFDTFVKFFMFDSFVCKIESGKLMPKNIINGKPLTEKHVNKIKSKGGEIQDLAIKDIQSMLKNVSNWVSVRTKSIEELFPSEDDTFGNTLLA